MSLETVLSHRCFLLQVKNSKQVKWLSKVATYLFKRKRFTLRTLILYINIFLFRNRFKSTVSSPYTVRSLFSLCLLLFFFSFRRLICLPPRQEVVGDQSCEEVRSHATVSSEHQTQRLCQHKQTEHVQ